MKNAIMTIQDFLAAFATQPLAYMSSGERPRCSMRYPEKAPVARRKSSERKSFVCSETFSSELNSSELDSSELAVSELYHKRAPYTRGQKSVTTILEP